MAVSLGLGTINSAAILKQVVMWTSIIAAFAVVGLVAFLVVRYFLHNISVRIVEKVGRHYVLVGYDRAREITEKGEKKLKLWKRRIKIKRFDDKFFLPFKKKKAIEVCLIEGGYYPMNFAVRYSRGKSGKKIMAVNVKPVDYDVLGWLIRDAEADDTQYKQVSHWEKYGSYYVLGGLMIVVFLVGFFVMKYTNESVNTIMATAQDVAAKTLTVIQ